MLFEVNRYEMIAERMDLCNTRIAYSLIPQNSTDILNVVNKVTLKPTKFVLL